MQTSSENYTLDMSVKAKIINSVFKSQKRNTWLVSETKLDKTTSVNTLKTLTLGRGK